MGPVLGNLDPYLGTRTRLCTQKLAQYRWDILYSNWKYFSRSWEPNGSNGRLTLTRHFWPTYISNQTMAYFGPLKCCSLRIFVFCIGILFLLVQTAFLILTFILMRDIENHVENFIDWLSEWGVFLPPPTLIDGSLTEDGSSLRTHLIKVRYELFHFWCNKL